MSRSAGGKNTSQPTGTACSPKQALGCTDDPAPTSSLSRKYHYHPHFWNTVCEASRNEELCWNLWSDGTRIPTQASCFLYSLTGKTDRPSVTSLPEMTKNHQSWVRTKPRASNSILASPIGGRGPSSRVFCRPPRCTSRKLDQKLSSQDTLAFQLGWNATSSCLMCCPILLAQDFTCC